MLHIGSGSGGLFLVPGSEQISWLCRARLSSGHGQGLEHAPLDPKQTQEQSCPKSIGNFVSGGDLEAVASLGGGLQGSEGALNNIAAGGEM